ncbi:MAG TPA: hypothetical protein VGS27_24540 [Candidatus Sulfotelmatobacter sp.]|nr:hypothetical protein [Candidatus Sulfotelmatobacter sp.]
MKEAKEVIFSGTVLAAENPPESGTLEGQDGQARYTFRVEEAFSSGIPKEIDVYSGRGGADCSFHFRAGEKYLVDGWRGSTGSISVSICSKTRFFRDSDPLLAELRFIRDGKKPDSLFGVLRRTQEPWGGASDPGYNQPLGDRAITLRLGVQEFHATSDVDGRYIFRELPPGKYSVWADLPPKLVLGEYILDGPVPSLVVAADACGEYDIKALPTGRISGQVRAQDETGVSGWDATDIQLFRADRYTEKPTGWGDTGWRNFPKDGGYFFFDHVAPGDYILVYNASNTTDGHRKFPRTFYPSSPDVDHATRIHVGEGESVTDIVVHVVAKTPSK